MIEVSTLALLGVGLLAAGILLKKRRDRRIHCFIMQKQNND